MDSIIKKHKEFLILTKVYNMKKITIKDSEKPDFILKSQTEKFGVEITEYYYNESIARLKNFKNYSKKILDSNSSNVLDKRDVNFIKKVSLYIKDNKKDKYEFISDTIQLKYKESYNWGELPKYVDFEDQLLNIIKSKNKKSNDYKKDLDYLELFIDDKEAYLEKHIKEIENSIEIIKEVNKSNYKRIYIFSGKHLFIIGTNPEENMKKYN